LEKQIFLLLFTINNLNFFELELDFDHILLSLLMFIFSQSKNKVIVGLADGSVAVFTRTKQGLWDLRNYYLICFDSSHHSVRCISNVYDNIWCGCRNKVYIFNSIDLSVQVRCFFVVVVVVKISKG
jgi:hypothetical protein